MLIYLASPLKNQEINLCIHDFLIEHDYECFLPQEDTPQSQDKLTVDSNIKAIKKSDIILVVGKDIGNDTSWEVGFSKGLGKPIILLCEISDASMLQKHLMVLSSVSQVVYLESYSVLEGILKFLPESIESRTSQIDLIL